MSDAISHHIPEAVMASYVAGTLPHAFSLVVASHISLCDECRARLDAFDSIGGAVLEDQSETAELADDSFAATMALIAGTAPEAPAPVRAPGILPEPLQDYVGGDVDQIRWRPVGMGVKQAILPTSKGASARLLFIPAGAAMPDHGHNGIEMTMVLQGAFQDDDEYFARGDVEFADADLHHTPVADIHEDCICLAVTDAPLRFQGILPKIVQKFARI